MENDDCDFELKKVLLHYTNYYFDKYVSENFSMYAANTFLDTDFHPKLLKKWWLFMKTQYNEFDKEFEFLNEFEKLIDFFN